MNWFLFLGALNGFISVACGAFGAHVLEGMIEPKLLDNWQTAVRYEMFHAAGLLIIGLLNMKFQESKLIKWAGWLMFSGIVVFSGSLFAYSLTGIKKFGAITPIGGFLFLASWILIMIVAKKFSQK